MSSVSLPLRAAVVNMLRLLPAMLLGGSGFALGGQPASCPVTGSTPLSCHNTTAVANLCCFNAPGGQLLQTQFWDTNPVTGPSNSWTVHGLWPDHCDGTFDQFCDPNRQYTNITDILSAAGATDLLNFMNVYWKDQGGNDESFWEHEWGKHGTCINTLDPQCYTNYVPQEEVVDFFNKTVSLFQTLPTYKFLSDAGITPSTSATYSSSAILAALKAPRGVDVAIQCNNNALDEVWYFFNVQGSVETGNFVPSNPDGSKSSCPATGVQYLPKSGGTAPTSTTSSAGSGPTGGGGGSGTPFSGKGYLNVIPSGSSSSKGCLISNGKWLVGGTCATYTAAASGSSGGFTLTSSKGPCALSGGSLSCASGNSASVFQASSSGGLLANGAGSSWFSAKTPTGTDQETVYSSSQSVTIAISWQAL